MITELPKIRAIMKVRNEEKTIKDVLDHWSPYVTEGFYIYDDVSTDKTVEICKAHPKVMAVIEGDYWDRDREKAEWFNRQMALMRAQQDAGPDDWFVYLDADEFIYNFDQYELFYDPKVKAIACRLYDIYITPEDKDLSYRDRAWVGPEFRTIVFFFRNDPALRYHLPDQRIVTLPQDVGNVPIHGDIKHYGKGFSVEQWEATCDYYVKFWPKYADKWRKRKGKAVHEEMMSDFGNKLIKWSDRHKGFSLESQTYGQN